MEPLVRFDYNGSIFIMGTFRSKTQEGLLCLFACR